MNYNYDDVFYKIVSEKNEEKFGCSTPWQPPMKSRRTGKEIKICNDSASGKGATATFNSQFNSGLGPENEPCSVFNVAFGLPFIDNKDNPDNEAYIRLYLKTKIKVKSVVLYYDFTTLIAELGGYIGMFLGVSLVDVTLLFNGLFLKVIDNISN